MGLGAAAPFNRCVSCSKGSTTTIVVLEGVRAFHVSALETLGGLARDRAEATVRDNVRKVYGSDPGELIEDRFVLDFRLCRKCAERTGADIVQAKDVLDGKPASVYVQPPAFGEKNP